MPFIDSPLNACLVLIVLWSVNGLAGLLRLTSLLFVGRTLFPLGALCGLVLAAAASMATAGEQP
jgi:hypothetical protein